MSNQTSQEPASAIAVFYPGNSLMHQVANWALSHPAYEFALSFAQSLHEIRSVLRRTMISIVDATEDPTRAMAAFAQAVAALEAARVAVYTEAMHDGLELFVRARGAPLLLGPLDDAPWEEQLGKMLQSAARAARPDYHPPQHPVTGRGLPKAWLSESRLQTPLGKRLPRSFQERS